MSGSSKWIVLHHPALTRTLQTTRQRLECQNVASQSPGRASAPHDSGEGITTIASQGQAVGACIPPRYGTLITASGLTLANLGQVATRFQHTTASRESMGSAPRPAYGSPVCSGRREGRLARLTALCRRFWVRGRVGRRRNGGGVLRAIGPQRRMELCRCSE